MLGRRTPPPADLVIALTDLPPPPARPFYQRLNQILDEAGFEPFVEDSCRPYYDEDFGRPGVPPGVYFRMLFYGYFEGLSSQRAIAWHCSDSRSARAFLGMPPHKPTPDQSSLTNIRKRLPHRVHEQVFVFVLKLAQDKGLLPGKTVAVDSTFLEANASMKTIVRRNNGMDWKEYLRRLAEEAGIEDPSDEELRRFDRQRPHKKVSNQEWVSPSDPDSKIAKMKDGTTHLAYKAEHVVDVQTELILAAPVYAADQADSATVLESVLSAEVHLLEAESGLSVQELAKQPQAAVAPWTSIEEVAADKNYHKAETLAACAAIGVRTYIPEIRRSKKRVWTDKPAAWQRAYRNNRRRVRGQRSKRLQKLRSEKAERTFAHVCETGGGRRSWLRGLLEVGKRYLMQVAAHNLGVIMRRVFGKGTPRSLQGTAVGVWAWMGGWSREARQTVLFWWFAEPCRSSAMLAKSKENTALQVTERWTFSTGC
jgi:transposase